MYNYLGGSSVLSSLKRLICTTYALKNTHCEYMSYSCWWASCFGFRNFGTIPVDAGGHSSHAQWSVQG